MSEDVRQHLASTLSALSNEDKAWVINFLVQEAFSVQPKRKAKKNRRDELTDEQWEEYFGHQPAVPLPEETVPMKDVLAVSSGKTIRQMEKWL